METRILKPEEWHMVEPVMRDVFNDSMPVSTEQATFLAAVDRDRLTAFVHLEQLFFMNDVWVAPEYRKARLGWRMVSEVNSLIPKGFSCLVATRREATARLLERVGCHEVGSGKRWMRKDY